MLCKVVLMRDGGEARMRACIWIGRNLGKSEWIWIHYENMEVGMVWIQGNRDVALSLCRKGQCCT